VEQLSIDGAIRPALISDNDRWRRVIFDRPDSAAFQRMNDTFIDYAAAVNTRDGAIALTKPTEKNWKASLKYQRLGQSQMTLDGQIDGHSVHAEVRFLDRTEFLLVNRGFHWIQEYPFNR